MIIDILTINNELIEVNLSIGETITHSQYGYVTIINIDMHNYISFRSDTGYIYHFVVIPGI